MNAEGDEERPRPAATLVLVRDSQDGPEVLLTVRPKKMRFMGGAVVFPGGALSPADLDSRWSEASTHSHHTAAATLEMSDEAAALGTFVCALREAFEEVGFLIGSGPLKKLRPHDADDPERFLSRCLELGIVLDTDQLVPAGRWVTPQGSPVRFDAQFFVTRAPAGFEPSPSPKEVAQWRWSTPAEALTELAEGRAVMAPPTVEMLQRLEGHATVDDLLGGVINESSQERGDVLVARLSPTITVVLAPNPSLLTGPGTNTYVVGTGPTVVIDPAIDEEPYLTALLEAAGEVQAVLVTHRHPDHVGGVAAVTAATGAPVRAFGPEPAGGIEVEPLVDGETIEVEGTRLVTVHAPGHTPDHVAFYMPEGAALFAGDNILGEGTAVIAPPEGDMGDYIASLQRLRVLEPERILTGHFKPLGPGTEAIDGYLEHRAEREAMILGTLNEPTTIDAIVEAVYVDTPTALHPIARLQVQAHLELLAKKGLAVVADELWRRTDVD